MKQLQVSPGPMQRSESQTRADMVRVLRQNAKRYTGVECTTLGSARLAKYVEGEATRGKWETRNLGAAIRLACYAYAQSQQWFRATASERALTVRAIFAVSNGNQVEGWGAIRELGLELDGLQQLYAPVTTLERVLDACKHLCTADDSQAANGTTTYLAALGLGPLKVHCPEEIDRVLAAAAECGTSINQLMKSPDSWHEPDWESYLDATLGVMTNLRYKEPTQMEVGNTTATGWRKRSLWTSMGREGGGKEKTNEDECELARMETVDVKP